MGHLPNVVPEVSSEELAEIQSFWKNHSTNLVSAQEAVYHLLENYRKGEGKKKVRLVLARHVVSDTPVKRVESVVDKILRHRTDLIAANQDPNGYGLKHIDDWIGAKVLCPYPSDVNQVIEWLLTSRKFSDVQPSNQQILQEVRTEKDFKDKSPEEQVKEAARRDRERKKEKRGYLAWHFLVRTHAYSKYPCEVQIKTLLDEAWDAKTHDVSYKRLKVNPKLGEQMKLLSRALEVSDEQSETVKALIEEEETQHQRRKMAAIQQYLLFLQLTASNQEPELVRIWAVYQPPQALSKEEASGIDKGLNERPLTAGTCHSRALLSVVTDRADLEVSAIECANSFVAAEQKSGDPERYAKALRVRAISRWALGETRKAIEDLDTALALTFGDQQLRIRLKSLYAYYVAEIRDKDRREKALQYLGEDTDSSRAKDTLGLVKVVFAERPEGVNEGRQLLLEAIDEARKSKEYSSDSRMLAYAEAFHRLHDYIAVRRLLEFYQQHG